MKEFSINTMGSLILQRPPPSNSLLRVPIWKGKNPKYISFVSVVNWLPEIVYLLFSILKRRKKHSQKLLWYLSRHNHFERKWRGSNEKKWVHKFSTFFLLIHVKKVVKWSRWIIDKSSRNKKEAINKFINLKTTPKVAILWRRQVHYNQ